MSEGKTGHNRALCRELDVRAQGERDALVNALGVSREEARAEYQSRLERFNTLPTKRLETAVKHALNSAN